MTFFPKPASFPRVALYAVLGVSIATQAQAFFIIAERPPPNGANGLTLNGLTLNGLTLNGLTVNGLTVNGLTLNGLTVNGLTVNGGSLNGREINGRVSQDLKLQAVTLANGERIELR